MMLCWMIWYCHYFLSGLKCIIQFRTLIWLYGYRYHVALHIGQLCPTTAYRTGFGVVCIVLVLSVIMCSLTNSLIDFYFVMIVVTFWWFVWQSFLFWTTRLGFLQQSSCDSANAKLPGCFRCWTLPLNIGLNMLPSDSFMLLCLDPVLGYSAGEFQTSQLIVLVVFGSVD